jgi:hypothetical protein
VTTTKGDCFEKAIEVAMSLGKHATIVHGIPLGQGGDAGGERFWHAWVEVGDTVIDQSNGLDATLSRDRYYEIGHIERTWRFSLVDARIEMKTRDHMGPWVDAYPSSPIPTAVYEEIP